MGITSNCDFYGDERSLSQHYASLYGKCRSPMMGSVLSPIVSKMKGLKKLKKRIGVVMKSKSRSNELYQSTLPALKFHFTKGKNIKLDNNRMLAIRENSFCNGITFTNRPVVIEEKICIKLVDVSDNWKGAIRFGFTNVNPATLKNLPKYACPGLNDRKRFWAKQVNEECIRKNSILYFYVAESGVVYYGINETSKEVLFDGVDTSTKLWAMIDVYGNSTAIELVNPKLNNMSLDQESGFDSDRHRRSADVTNSLENRLNSLTFGDQPKNINQYRNHINSNNSVNRPSTWTCREQLGVSRNSSYSSNLNCIRNNNQNYSTSSLSTRGSMNLSF